MFFPSFLFIKNTRPEGESLPLPAPQSVTRNEIRETKYGDCVFVGFFSKRIKGFLANDSKS
jgi:hypothetical protein